MDFGVVHTRLDHSYKLVIPVSRTHLSLQPSEEAREVDDSIEHLLQHHYCLQYFVYEQNTTTTQGPWSPWA